MTDKELRKLSKTEILQLLVSFSQDADEMSRRIQELSARLEEKEQELKQAHEAVSSSLKIMEQMEIFRLAAQRYVRQEPSKGMEETR